MKKFVLAALLFTACQGEITHPDDPGQARAPSVLMRNTVDGGHWDGGTDDPYEVPGGYKTITACEPWAAGNFPLQALISLNNDASITDPVAMVDLQKAADYLNEIAGEELIHVITDYRLPHTTTLLYGPLPDGAGAFTSCPGGSDPNCYITTTHDDWVAFHRLKLGPAMWTHEFMHDLGYYSETGDVHDDGVMAPGITWFDITPRHRAYLECLGRVAHQQWLDSYLDAGVQ